MTDGSCVLVVDDNDDLRNGLALLLETDGYAVSTAAHGEEALRALALCGTRPALILLDLAMPVMDGRELLARLAEDPVLSAIPVAIMSAALEGGGVDLVAQVVAVLRKPVSYDQIRDVVTAHARSAASPDPTAP